MARNRQAVALASLGAAVMLGGLPLGAQQIQGSLQRGIPGRDTPRLAVLMFRSPDPSLSVDVADETRDRLQRDLNARQLFIVTKNDVVNTLKASGYPTDEALNANDAVALARIVRADQWVEGNVQPAQQGGYNVTARLVMARENKLVQPLGTFTVGKLDDAARQISREVQAARKQLEAEQKCVNLYRESKFQEAAAAAVEGAQEYPNATISRVCRARALKQANAPADSILALTSEILRIHEQNRPALELAYESYKEKGMQDEALNALTTLLSLDPSNATLQNAVIAELTANRRFEIAIPIIERALVENPIDPQLLSTAFKVYLATESYDKAQQVGEQLIPLDTTVTDSTFYIGLARAYAADSQPQKAAEAAARGTQRFTNNATLWTVAGQFYRQAGQLEQAQSAIARAVSIDPNVSGAALLRAQIFADQEMPDSALAALRNAPESDKATAAQLALAFGSQQIQKNAAEPGPWKLAEQYLAVSDSLAPSEQAKLYRGVAAFQVVAKSYSDVAQSKDCGRAQEIQSYARIAQINIPAGGRANPQLAGQLMGNLGQLTSTVDQLVKAVCR